MDDASAVKLFVHGSRSGLLPIKAVATTGTSTEASLTILTDHGGKTISMIGGILILLTSTLGIIGNPS